MFRSTETDCETMSPALLWSVGVAEHGVTRVYRTLPTGKKTRGSTFQCNVSLYP